MVNQFSFWPRYDEFVELNRARRPGERSLHEENGINLFMGRERAFHSGWRERTRSA